MHREISPAVERAATLAREHAAANGAGFIRLVDWLICLLDDAEGRPVELLNRLGVDVARILNELPDLSKTDQKPAPAEPALFAAARDHAIRLRGDPLVTTDLVLVALITADHDFAASLADYGISLTLLESALRRTDQPHPIDNDTKPQSVFTIAEPTDQMAAGRIVDANLNRAREALRVLDDYARFHLNDAFLTGQLKSVRHQLAEASQTLPHGLLLAGRDTQQDVGTHISTVAEFDRDSVRQVAAINFKRLQESLRSAEEYGKVLAASFGEEVERIRYETYTLERAVLRSGDAHDRLADVVLYVLLSSARCTAALDWTIAEAADGGAQIIQLREKELPDRELLTLAKNVRKWTRTAGVLFIVNDRPDIARLVEADGVHLGQDDLPIHEARRIVGPDAVIGVSTHTIEQVHVAVLAGADYLGVGPTFPSRTKSFDQFPGLPFIAAVTAETSLPAFALGGIIPANISAAVTAGARRVAVGDAVAAAADPRAVATQLRIALAQRVVDPA